MPTVLLVRHGQASFGTADYDVLSAAGIAQAEAIAADLAPRGVRVDRVVSGSLLRQRDTAAPIAEAAGVPVTIDPRWDEYATDEILAAHSESAARTIREAGSAAPEISSRDFQAILESALLEWVRAGDDGPTTETWPAFAA